MSLKVWLPLTKDLRNQGLDNVTVTNNGATFNSAGKLGGCYSFSGNNIQIPNVTISKNIWSVACWFYPTADSSGGHQYMVGMNTSTAADFTFTICFYQNKFAVRTAGTTYLGGAAALNTWHHIVATFDGTNLKLYTNGILALTQANPATPVAATTVFCGMRGGGAGYFSGKLNDVRIYDHCLSPMEVKELSKGLILHYPLNRGGWGQENLITGYDTSFLSYPDGAVTLFSNQMNGGAQEIVSNIGGAVKCLHLHSNGGNGRQFGMLSATSGKSYIISCDYYSTSSQAVPFRGELNGGNYSWAGSNAAAYTTPNKWVRLSFSYLNLTSNATIYYFMQCSQNTDCYIKNLKIEEGSIATSWCPNSSDTLATTMGLNGTTEYDCSGYCNNGTRTGTFSWTSDTPKYQVSTTFDGTNYISTTTSGADILTLSCWVKTSKNKSTSQIMVADSTSQLCISFYSGTIITFYASSGYSTGSKCTLGNAYKENDWNHLVVVKTGTGTRKVYCNGVEQTATSNDYWSSSSTGFTVARRETSTPNAFYGELCDVRAYATALSADDVKSLYQNSAYIDSSGNVYGAVHSEV